MRKVTLTLDDETLGRLDRLAQPRAGNKSFVVREAIRLMWESDEIEERLADVEADPAFQASMARALKEIRDGNVVQHEEVERKVYGRRKSPRRR